MQLDVAPAEPVQELSRGITLEQRRALERDLGSRERELEVGRPCVQAVEHRHFLVWDSLGVKRLHALDDHGELVRQRPERLRDRLGPGGHVARSVFSAPPSFGTSRLASESTSGVER